MKKKFMLGLALCAALAVTGCSQTSETAETTAAETTAAAEETTAAETAAEESEETSEEAEATEAETAEEAAEAEVMTYEEYMAADLDTQVTVATYVQAKQSWWENQATVYSQDEDGAYFLYNMACSEEDYEKLVPGTKIIVTGYKSEWSGEVEIIDATFTFADDGEEFIALPIDVTDMLGTDDLINHQNQLVTFSGLTVEAAGQDEEGNVPERTETPCTPTPPTTEKPTPSPSSPISAIIRRRFIPPLKTLRSDRPSTWKDSCTGMRA